MTRTVNVVIGNAPVITLIGSTPVNLTTGSTYTDAGATASDIEDGNITGNITHTGSVNTSLVGTYTITYNVIDASGNNATPVVRTINVTAPTSGGGGGGGGSSSGVSSTIIPVKSLVIITDEEPIIASTQDETPINEGT